MASNVITVSIKTAWYVAPSFRLAGFFVWLATRGIKAVVK